MTYSVNFWTEPFTTYVKESIEFDDQGNYRYLVKDGLRVLEDMVEGNFSD